jgi:hypothetical protein
LVPGTETLQYLVDLKNKLHPEASVSYYNFAIDDMYQVEEEQVANYHVCINGSRKMNRPQSLTHLIAERFANAEVKQQIILKDGLVMSPDQLLRVSTRITWAVLEMICICEPGKLGSNISLKDLYTSHIHHNQTMKEDMGGQSRAKCHGGRGPLEGAPVQPTGRR